MIGQHVLLREPGLALVARKRLLPGVDPLHVTQTRMSSACPTPPLPSSWITSVPAVHLKRRILGEPGLTVGALVRPRARVRPMMQHQGRFGAERLSAVGADVLQVAPFVDLTCNRGAEDRLRVFLFSTAGQQSHVNSEQGAPVSGDGPHPSSV